MKPLRWKLYTDGSKQGIYKRRGTTDLQDGILAALQSKWHGTVSVLVIELMLRTIEADITPTVLTADLLQLQDMGLVTIDQNPQFLVHTGWIVNLQGLEWRDCPCCGRVASFWPQPQFPKLTPVAPTPRKRGRPARIPLVSPPTPH